MSWLEWSGIAFWVAAFLVFCGYVIACVYADLYESGPALDVDALVLRADQEREVSRPHVRAGVYQKEKSL